MPKEVIDSSLGQILISLGVVDREYVEHVVARLEKEHNDKLGDMLIELKACDKDQIDVALRIQAGLRSKEDCVQARAMAELATYRKVRRQQETVQVRAFKRELDSRPGYASNLSLASAHK